MINDDEVSKEEQLQINADGTITLKRRKRIKTKDKNYENFYLKIKTIKRLSKNAKKAGMKKSEFVDFLLNAAMDRLEIE